MTIFPAHFANKNTQKKCFVRSLNEKHIREDFLKNYNDKLNRELSNQDTKFLDILKTPSTESEKLAITNVVEMKYRMTIYFEQLTPKVNIIIAWLLLFIGSLDYQLNPHLFTEESGHTKDK